MTADVRPSGPDPVPPVRSVGEDEDARLAEFGYEQRLDRSVGKIASFAIGFSTISATTAVFLGFGAGYLNAGSPFIWTLFLAIPVFLVWTLIAADVAASAVDGWAAGKTVIVPGVFNRVGAAAYTGADEPPTAAPITKPSRASPPKLSVMG